MTVDLGAREEAETRWRETEVRPPPGAAEENRPSKRLRPRLSYPYIPVERQPYYSSYSNPQTSSPVPVPGRYVSKRERSLMASIPSLSNTVRSSDSVENISSASSSVLGSISDSELPGDFVSSLKHRQKGYSGKNQMPSRVSISIPGHTKAVTSIDWSTSHVHLLASAGLDGVVHVWNVWSRDEKKVRAFHNHKAAVKEVKWSKQGLTMLSCGYDCCSRLVDVEKGLEIQSFKEDQVIGAVEYHPHNYNLFLSGGFKGSLRLWDIRANKVVHEYIKDLGPILDLEFVNDGHRFISSSDVSSRNMSENAIIVWDISREVPLSKQVYAEAYTCPCIKRHPQDSIFVAQSNGNYTAIFSTNPPFKLNKYKRYESHWVSGFPIKCEFSLDGETLLSGSSDGSIYMYSYRSSKLVKTLKAYEQPCIDVAPHPTLCNVLAACSWLGEISLFE